MTEVSDASSAPPGTYDDGYYEKQVALSYNSARAYAAKLTEVWQPQSVADFGCGRGAWLKAFGEAGAARLIGFDGSWNSADKMIDRTIEFRPVDLNAASKERRFAGEKFDLAMSLEVAEHLLPDRSPQIAQALCDLSDVVMFGAAFTHQPGTDHINTRNPSFWAGLFADNGYNAYDYFRPSLWGMRGIPYWYQQNTYLYVRQGHELNATLAAAGYMPVKRLELLDAVHPVLFEKYASQGLLGHAKRSVRVQMEKTLPKSVMASVRRMQRRISPS